jgi:hypothetical protein
MVVTTMPSIGAPAPLWISLRGASRLVAVAWLAWLVGAALLAWLAAPLVGAAGIVVALPVCGWLLARTMPSPLESFRAYHIDDEEVIALGPWRHVVRLAWGDMRACTQTRRGLVLDGALERVVLPLAGLVDSGGWTRTWVRGVPARAHAMWRALERGAVALTPPPDPPMLAVAWWAWGPAVLGATVLGDTATLIFGLGLAAAERLVVQGRCRWRQVVLQPSGMVVPGARRRLFAAWDAMHVEPTEVGLEVQALRGGGTVPAEVPDFWAAVAVIELHARLGFLQPAAVAFHATLDDEGVAVVGEVEAL